MSLIPPVNHIIFIPIILGLGFVLGWRLGTTNVRNQWDRFEKKRRDREENA